MTLVEGEELQRLWTLVSELSSQLSANQQLCQSLQAQADELKGQALHSGTGYTLRRFNLDISKEKFESELEKVNSQLVMENQQLAHENKQISILLREYESTLETIMAKFRSFSHATQQHTLALTSHYETLLSNNAYEVANADLRANTAFSEHLSHLGSLVRLALRDFEGEANEEHDDAQTHDVDPFEAEGYRVGSPSGAGPSGPSLALAGDTVHSSSSSSPALHKVNSKKVKQPYGSAAGSNPKWHGTGGYTGFQGDPNAEVANHALENRIEEERLREENEMLRNLLRISTDLTPEVAERLGIEMPPPPTASSSSGWPGSAKLSLGKPRGSRKSLGETSLSAIAPAENSADEKHDSSTEQHDGLRQISEDAGDHETAIEDEEHITESDTISPSSTQTQKSDLAHGLDHVTEGAGAPPQLSDTADGSDIGLSSPSGGIVITPDNLEQVTEVEASENDEQSISSTALGLQSMTAATAKMETSPAHDLVDAGTSQTEDHSSGSGSSSSSNSSSDGESNDSNETTSTQHESPQSSRADKLLDETEHKLKEATLDSKDVDVVSESTPSQVTSKNSSEE
ncbi:uncharacterized protein FA14DRAFT_160812 [Meira miltonrushii]|uniref:Uncharacterized protein n=1 Tax=Meira miltonrushii TaxID=1280837 RepID=A0A316VE35_9BASI|nr:uncharacterized protein FA14DRAFT_160812 [Meira miltonrushii]PWN35816.1 hypothetical protein FA14DRAFT_160812 [Meira miltonrushii]